MNLRELEKMTKDKEKLSEEYRFMENTLTELGEEINQTNKKRKKNIETKKQEELKVFFS